MRRLVSLILSIFAFSSTGAIAQDMVRPLAATAIAPAPTKISDKSLLPGLAQADALNHATPVQMLQAGDLYLHYGFFSRAIKQWREILVTQGRSHDPKVVPIVDAAIGQLASLYTRLGMFDALEKLLSEIGTRPITGSATEAVQAAREAHAQVKTNSRRLFLCGPLALRVVTGDQGIPTSNTAFLAHEAATPRGTNLAQLHALAVRAGMPNVLVRRQTGSAVPVPSVIHWRQGHFAAIVGQENGLYHVIDPSFPGGGLWVPTEAIDQEGSGNFLIPERVTMHSGWHLLSAGAAGAIWGRGPTTGVQPGDAGDPPADDPDNDCPMCGYNILEASVSLTLSDQPVGYQPAVGPAVKPVISYNQREDSQPAMMNFFNMSPKWTLSWQTYIIDDPANPGGSVSRYLSGGGAYYYTGYNTAMGTFSAQNTDGSILALASTTPVRYVRRLRDGSVETYAQSDDSAVYPRHVFLSQIDDPQGNSLRFTYDSANRLVSATDAVGRVTTLSYQVVGFPLLVSAITDPFGREARFRYDTTGRLVAITDIIGITSSFSYDANNLVNTLTTPYGTSHFLYTAPTDSGPPRFVDVQDPLGRHEREEWVEPSSNSGSDPSSSVPVGMPQGVNNSYLNYRTSFHWNKDQYVAAGCTTDGGCDYTKARATQFTHYNGTSLKATAINTRKEPLENRVWFNYSDQTDGSLSAGSYNGPIATGRVVDDGSSQISLISYDTAGFFKPTRFIDPMGRTLSLAYTNHIDLAAISRQKEAGGQDILAQYIYDTRHRPVVARDAAGGMSSYAYNAAGQLVSRTNPLNQTTTYAYDTLGELLSVTNANGKVQSSFTYDAFGRVATVSDSEGWTKRYDYDAADRPTRVTYPDGSSQTYRYDRLDLAVYTNRSGQSWHYTYDAGRNLTSVTDPAGEVTAYARNGQGQVTTLTDPRGNETQFAYDVQGRLTSRTYADHSAITYGYAQTISRLISRQDALGQVTHYTYGLDGLLLGRSYTNAVNVTPGVSYVWDRFYRRQVSMTDGNGTTSYSYGAAGSAGAQRLTGEVGPQSDTTRTYGYDVLGRLVTRTTAGGGAESFRYDALGRLIGHGNDLGSFTLAYLGQTAQVSSRTLDGSTTLGTVWGYQDNTHDRRLASVSNTGLSATQRSVFALETNQLGQVTSVDQSGDAVPETLTASARTLSYNALNQAITMNGQAISYDANGNLLSDGTRSFSWDVENRLIGVSTSAQSGANAHYSYDGRGRRVSQSVVAAGSAVQTTTSWLWCGNVLCQARDASGTVLREILSEGEYLPGQSPQALYYGVDQIGSVRRVFATAGSAPAYDYDAYGLPLYTGSPLTLRGYAGLLTDPVGGTSGARYRTYDPLLMRWLSRDPLGEGTGAGQGTNLYGYVLGDPLGATDPSGMLCWPKWLDDNPILEALGLMLALGGPEDPLADALALAPFYDEVAAVAAEVAEGIGAEAADLVSSSIGEGAAEEGTTSLYRAVGPAELEDIQATGAFRNLGWAEGKYFTTSGEAASSYARQAVNSFGDRPYTIVQSNVPNSVLKGMSPVNVDGGIPAYVIPNESLPSLTPNIMNYSPIPGVK